MEEIKHGRLPDYESVDNISAKTGDSYVPVRITKKLKIMTQWTNGNIIFDLFYIRALFMFYCWNLICCLFRNLGRQCNWVESFYFFIKQMLLKVSKCIDNMNQIECNRKLNVSVKCFRRYLKKGDTYVYIRFYWKLRSI